MYKRVLRQKASTKKVHAGIEPASFGDECLSSEPSEPNVLAAILMDRNRCAKPRFAAGLKKVFVYQSKVFVYQSLISMKLEKCSETRATVFKTLVTEMTDGIDPNAQLTHKMKRM